MISTANVFALDPFHWTRTGVQPLAETSTSSADSIPGASDPTFQAANGFLEFRRTNPTLAQQIGEKVIEFSRGENSFFRGNFAPLQGAIEELTSSLSSDEKRAALAATQSLVNFIGGPNLQQAARLVGEDPKNFDNVVKKLAGIVPVDKDGKPDPKFADPKFKAENLQAQLKTLFPPNASPSSAQVGPDGKPVVGKDGKLVGKDGKEAGKDGKDNKEETPEQRRVREAEEKLAELRDRERLRDQQLAREKEQRDKEARDQAAQQAAQQAAAAAGQGGGQGGGNLSAHPVLPGNFA